MKFLLDSADLKNIELYSPFIHGITTNPSLLQNKDRIFFLKEVESFKFKHCSFQVEGSSFEEQKREASLYLDYYPSLVIKVPFTPEGLKTLIFLREQNVEVNVTLIFSLHQALLASSLGASFVSPFIGRLLDQKENPFLLLEELKKNLPITTSILAASIRNLDQLHKSLIREVDYVTLPPKIYQEIFSHPLTLKGLDLFNAFRPEKPLTELSF